MSVRYQAQDGGHTASNSAMLFTTVCPRVLRTQGHTGDTRRSYGKIEGALSVCPCLREHWDTRPPSLERGRRGVPMWMPSARVGDGKAQGGGRALGRAAISVLIGHSKFGGCNVYG